MAAVSEGINKKTIFIRPIAGNLPVNYHTSDWFISLHFFHKKLQKEFDSNGMDLLTSSAV